VKDGSSPSTSDQRRTAHVNRENKAVVRRFIEETQNVNNLDAIDEIFAADFVNRSRTVTTVSGMETDREGVKQITRLWRAAFPEQRVTVEEVVAD
jgi:SnoaL-like protein